MEACDLPLSGAREALDGYMAVMTIDGALVGCAALERYGRSGLLRSAAVSPEWRGHMFAASLVANVLATARAEGLMDVTLLTTTAADSFTRCGFHAPRENAPEAVRASVEFRKACPESATVMIRELR